MTKFYIQQESCGVDIEKMQKKSTPAEQQQFVEKQKRMEELAEYGLMNFAQPQDTFPLKYYKSQADYFREAETFRRAILNGDNVSSDIKNRLKLEYEYQKSIGNMP